MAQKNVKLHKAKENKNDEFYTRMEDISKELNNYKEFLNNKRIICPCDWDGNYCNGKRCKFIHFLEQVKKAWNIKSIDYSGYNPKDPKNKQGLNNIKKFQDIDYNQYDIVITNPPFSQFREFIDKVKEYSYLKFIIIAPKSSIHYKEVVSLLLTNKIWPGYNLVNWFEDENGQKIGSPCFWFTNFNIKKRNEKLVLQESFYKKTINYENDEKTGFLNVDKTMNIPFDYEHKILVPDSFLFKWNPSQFKILGCRNNVTIQGKRKYSRLIIQNLKPVKNQEDQYE